MTSCGEIKFGSGLSRGPGLPGWLHEYSLGADRGVCKWTAEEQVRGCVYPSKQCVVYKYTEEEDVKTPRLGTFHTEMYFLSSFLFLVSYNFSYFVIIGDFPLTHN